MKEHDEIGILQVPDWGIKTVQFHPSLPSEISDCVEVSIRRAQANGGDWRKNRLGIFEQSLGSWNAHDKEDLGKDRYLYPLTLSFFHLSLAEYDGNPIRLYKRIRVVEKWDFPSRDF
jgi:hypothetical protein